jgi:hypothetical protein
MNEALVVYEEWVERDLQLKREGRALDFAYLVTTV